MLAQSACVAASYRWVLLACDPVRCDRVTQHPHMEGLGSLTGESWSPAGIHNPVGSLPSAASLCSLPSPHLLSDFPELPDLQKLGLESSCLAPWPSWYGPKVLAGPTLSLAMWMESSSLDSVLWVLESAAPGMGAALNTHVSTQGGCRACPQRALRYQRGTDGPGISEWPSVGTRPVLGSGWWRGVAGTVTALGVV